MTFWEFGGYALVFVLVVLEISCTFYVWNSKKIHFVLVNVKLQKLNDFEITKFFLIRLRFQKSLDLVSNRCEYVSGIKIAEVIFVNPELLQYVWNKLSVFLIQRCGDFYLQYSPKTCHITEQKIFDLLCTVGL